MLASAAYAPPCRATTYFVDGSGGCSVHTVMPSKSLCSTFRPLVMKAGGIPSATIGTLMVVKLTMPPKGRNTVPRASSPSVTAFVKSVVLPV